MYTHPLISSKTLGVLLAATVGAAGPNCLPKRVFWSPDGQKVVILGNEGTYLATDKEWQLSRIDSPWEQVAWFPDGRRLVCVWPRELSSWSQVAEALGPEKASSLLQIEPEFRKQILQHNGPWEKWRPDLPQKLTDPELIALWIYVREHHTAQMQEKLGDQWAKLARINLALRLLQMCDLADNRATLGKVLAQSLDEIALDSVRVSPDGRKIAYVVRNVYPDQPSAESENKTEPSDAGGALMLLRLEGNAKPQEVVDFAAWRNDFTADSAWLVYATAKPVPTGDSVVLGSIERRKIVDEQGNPRIGDPEHLAGIIYFPDTKVVCLPGGQILFSAASVHLPVAKTDVPPVGPTLFSMDPDRRATIAPMLTHEAEATAPMAGFELGTFDVRPDGEAVTLVGSGDDGLVAYYLFAAGEVHYVISKKEKWKLLERPAWRNNDELSLVVPPGNPWGSPHRPELVLYSTANQQAHCISRDWPDALMDTFQARSETRPASTQSQ